MRQRCRLILGLTTASILCLLLNAGAVWGDAFGLYGCTSRGTAMGSAMVGMKGDVSSLYYNPAALAEVDDVLVSFSYFHAGQDLKIDGKDTGVDTESGLTIGTVIPVRLLPGIKASGGALFFIPDKRLARYLLMPKDRPRFVMYSNDAQRMIALFPFAVEVTSWLDVGAGVSMLADMQGEQDIFASEAWTKVPSVGSHTESFTPAFSPYGGILLKYKDRVRLGITYADKSEFALDITPVVRLPDMYVYGPPNTPPVPLIRQTRIDAAGSQASFFSPAQMVVGLSVHASSRLTLATSLSWIRWSQYEEYTPRVKLNLGKGIPGKGIPPSPPGNLGDWVKTVEFPIPPPNFHDIVMPAVGLEYRALSARHVDLDLRCGYFYRPTPVPDQTGVTNFIDSPVHAPSFGVGVTLKDVFRVVTKPISFDTHFQYQILTTRRTVKANPGDPYGDYESNGSILNVGGTMTVRF